MLTIFFSNDIYGQTKVLTSTDLNKISYYLETGDPDSWSYIEQEVLDEYLEIELIEKSLFDNMKNHTVEFLLADTTENRKNNGVLELKCRDKTVKYTDFQNGGESMGEYHYIGYIDFFNKYLIYVGGNESWDFKFIDRTSGEETHFFNGYPFLSPDRKNIISVITNPYERTAEIALFAVSGGEITHLMSTSFTNWMPTVWSVEGGEAFWASDNYLYLSVNHSNSFWAEDGGLNCEFQYVRMKIINP